MYVENNAEIINVPFIVFAISSFPRGFITYYHILRKRNKTGATRRAGTTDPSGEPVFSPGICDVRVAQSSAFCVVFC